MFRSILLSAFAAGIVAAIALTLLQTAKVFPLISAAEVFEEQGRAAAPEQDKQAQDQGAEGAEGEAWMPADGGERWLYSLAMNVLIAVGLGLVLCALFALRQVTSWRSGLIWGLAGFVSVNLAPAVGLPPELPGIPAADLVLRQAWWLATVAATALGIAAILLRQGWATRLFGAALILAPHVIGAPHPIGAEASAVPAHLAAQFVAASLASNLVFWALLGILSALAMKRFATPPN